MVDETWAAKLYPSLRFEEDFSHARAVKDVTLQDATESTNDRVRRDDRGEVDQEECLKRTEKLHIQDQGQREQDARKAKEEDVVNVAESMHECNEQC